VRYSRKTFNENGPPNLIVGRTHHNTESAVVTRLGAQRTNPLELCIAARSLPTPRAVVLVSLTTLRHFCRLRRPAAGHTSYDHSHAAGKKLEASYFHQNRY
jgi:hypothetical protein